jgi:hypothetical protein
VTEEPSGVVAPPGRAWKGALIPATTAGLVVGAAAVGMPWLATRHNSSSEREPPLTAPDTLGGAGKANASPVKDDFAHHQFVQRNADDNRETSSRVSATYDCVPAMVQTYTAVDFTHSFQLTAIRVHTPGLEIPYEKKGSCLTTPTNDLCRLGDVTFALRNKLPLWAGNSFSTKSPFSRANTNPNLRSTGPTPTAAPTGSPERTRW